MSTLRGTMPVQQSDIDALNRAIADGVRSVTIRGQTVLYNTTDSLIQARDDQMRQLALEQASTEQRYPSRRTLMYHAGRGT